MNTDVVYIATWSTLYKRKFPFRISEAWHSNQTYILTVARRIGTGSADGGVTVTGKNMAKIPTLSIIFRSFFVSYWIAKQSKAKES